MKKYLLPTFALLIFSFSVTASASSVTGQEIILIAVGDTMLAGSSSFLYQKKGFDYAFAQTTAILKSADVTVANLEAPITSRGTEFASKQFRFRMRPEAARAMKMAGFSVVTLANNHMLDYGPEGLAETVDILKSEGIAHTGAGATLSEARKEAILTVRGKKVAFLAYSLTFPVEFWATAKSAGTAPGHLNLVQKDISRVKALADIVVVSFHWGAEKEMQPKPYQKSMAHSAIDAGADLVLGHHPHVLQGIEVYKGKTIFYSLGNFAFGCLSPSCRESIIARIHMGDDKQQIELLALNVANDEIRYQPAVMTGTRAESLMSTLNSLCRDFGTRVIRDGDTYRVLAEEPSYAAK